MTIMGGWRHAALAATFAAGLLAPGPVAAQEAEPGLASLQGVKPPRPPAAAYAALVKDEAWLRALGKALFWDGAVGSDGAACASCHFHAGADPRIKNQLNPGLNILPLADAAFGGTFPAEAAGLTRGGFLGGTGAKAAANITLTAADFPFHQLEDVKDRNSRVLYDTNDVASSQGVFDSLFVSLRQNFRFKARRRDFCRPGDDDIFVTPVNGVPKKVRKVEPRNTPTAINAAFFFRNFWDGRANNVFNGVDPFGRRSILQDPRVGIVTPLPSGGLRVEPLELENMSLASQAVGPPNSSFEMACAKRSFADIGRKLLTRVPLANQAVAGNDSVFGTGSALGRLVRPSGKGLKGSYLDLVQRAFQDHLWSSPGTYQLTTDGAVVADTAGYTQAELNFSLFFGLAIDAYERTLISDRTPFDRYMNGNATALTPKQKKGLELFLDKGRCVNCHSGPLLSSAAVPPRQEQELIENMAMGDGGQALYDGGFYNIGVRPTHEDVGLGASVLGSPFSFARQFVSGGNPVDRFPDPAGGRLDRVAVDGAFKTPTLRNVGLTAPYFHNGGTATLRQVVEFYNRGGDRRGPDGNDTTGTGPLGQSTPIGPGMGGSNLDPDITSLGLTDPEIDALVAFMLTLTDLRVACHAAPFDHPELIVPNGSQPVAAGARAKDARLRLQPVGRNGYAAAWCDPNTGDLFGRNLIGGMLQPIP